MGDSWLQMSASTSNLLLYFVFVDAYDENPVSQKYLVANWRSVSTPFFLAGDWYLLEVLLLSQKSVINPVY